jgi:hypothetical protein
MASVIRRGERQWQARVRRKSIRAGATFETKVRAVAWARQVEAEIDAGRFQFGRVEAERITLHEALDRYLANIVPTKRGIRQNTGIVRAWQRTPNDRLLRLFHAGYIDRPRAARLLSDRGLGADGVRPCRSGVRLLRERARVSLDSK